MKKSGKKLPVEQKNIHEGHRQRLKKSVLKDPEFESFSDIEVLEYILTFVIPRKDTNPISHMLISKFGSLYMVFNASYAALAQLPDITDNAAHLISNFFSLVRRIFQTKASKTLLVRSSKESATILAPFFAIRDTEYIYMMFLDVHEQVISVDMISEGFAAKSTLDITATIKYALKYNAVTVVMAHNHPGDDWRPSRSDIEATKLVYNALKLINVFLADHIIFTDEGFFSFFGAGLLVHSPLDCKLSNGHCNYNEMPHYACEYYFAEGEI